jgi:hypothetical protein
MQVLQQAVEAAQSLNDDKLADVLRKGTFQTIAGDISSTARTANGSSRACWRCSSRT